MIGGLKSISRLALVAAAGLVAGGVAAQAADLGGNCCADLEERVAELEATTARKGNRKVSLTISGQVNKALIWHDSDAADAYRADQVTVRDNDASMSRFRFVGSAKVNPDITMGYAMEIGVYEDFGTSTNPGGATFLIRQNHVYVDSKTLGRLTLGQAGSATDGAYEVSLASGIYRTMGGCDDEADMLGGGICGSTISPDGSRRQGIYYTTPTFAGFSASAGWGHKTQDTGATDTDEFWDVAARYAGEFGGFRLAGAIGYRQENDTNNTQDAEIVLGSASVMHVGTGLFLSGGAGQASFDDAARDYLSWYVVAGVEQKFFALGKTTIYGEYGTTDFDDVGRRDGTYYGAGISQAIDAAVTDLYLNWRNIERDALGATAAADANVVTAGMRIRF